MGMTQMDGLDGGGLLAQTRLFLLAAAGL